MSDLLNETLEKFPDCVIQVSNGTIVSMNSHATTEFPFLNFHCPLPSPLSALLESPQTIGVITIQGRRYTWSKIEHNASLFFFIHPSSPSSLNDQQISGLLRQTRACMQEILLNLQALASKCDRSPDVMACMEHISKNYCRTLRLLSNTQFLQQMEQPSHIVCRPIAMDAVAFCRQLSLETAGLLKSAGYELQFESPLPCLLMPGDPTLLRKLFLTLISNAVKASPASAPVQFILEQQQGRGIFTIINQITPTSTSLSRHLPLPDDGAGMGLPIAQHIVSLHKGTMLWDTRSDNTYRTVVSLPLSPMPKNLSVHTPKLEEDFGFSPILIELSDLLPPFLYQL